MSSKKKNSKISNSVVADDINSDEKKSSDENQESAKESDSRKKKPRKKGKWYFRLLRILFIWIPLTVIVLIAIALFAMKLYLSPNRVENLAVENFNKLSNGTLELDVKKFSPYSGFIIENIVLRNGEDFNKSIFVKIDRLVVDYDFFRMFTGSIKIGEIGIYNPSIFLVQRNGKWNFETLMIASDKSVTDEKEKSEETDEDSVPEELADSEEANKQLEDINLPVYVDFLFNFYLENLQVAVNAEAFKTELKDFSTSLKVYIPPFKKVKPGIEAVRLLEKMQLKVNPSQKLNLKFQSKEASVNPPLVFTWNLVYYDEQNTSDKTRFYSNLKLGTYKTPVRFQNKYLTPLNFLISYDLFFNPIDDYLTLNSFKVRFNNNNWVNVKGSISKVSTKQIINLRMDESRINLNELYPYYRQITGDRKMRFSGDVSLAPLRITGVPDNINIFSNISLSNINFSMPDLKFFTPLLSIQNDINFRMTAADVKTDLEMKKFLFTLERSKSKYNGITLSSNLSAYSNFKRFKINSFKMRYFNPLSRKNALTLDLSGNAYLGKSITGNFNISKITFNKIPLEQILPPSIAKSFNAVPLSQDVDLSMITSFNLGTRFVAADLSVKAKVPDFNINDLKIETSILQDNKKEIVTLKKYSLTSASYGLKVAANGFVEMKNGQPMTDSDLNFSVNINYPQMTNIMGPWMLKGSVQINTKVTGSLENAFAKGVVNIDDLYVYNDLPEMQLAMENFNFAFPFEYDLAAKYTGESKVAVDKSNFLSNENFREKENISLEAFKFKHPSRKDQIVYMSDMSGTMFFKNSTFEISRLKASIFGGNLLIKDTLFYLADLKPSNMEYKLGLNLTNLDISKLEKESKVKRNSQLSLNADLTGRGLDFSKGFDLKGYVNIYRIGDKLAGQLLKGLSENNGRSTLDKFTKFAVDNSMRVNSFYYYIDNGNVYTTVTFKRDFFGFFIGVEDEKVKFERIPVQEYLRNVQSNDQGE